MATRVEEIVLISSDEEEDVSPKRKRKAKTPKKTARKKVKKKEVVLEQAPEIDEISPASTQAIRCKYCGWKSQVQFGVQVFRCESCGFEPSPMKKDVILNQQMPTRIGRVANKLEETIVISSDEEEEDTDTRTIKNINELLRIKNSNLNNPHFPQRASVTHPESLKQSFRPAPTPPSANTPAGLLASLYPAGPKSATPSLSLSTTTSNNQNLPKNILQSENEAENETDCTDIHNDVEEKGSRVPKDWESAVCVGFPEGWEWKRTNAWSRRVKFRSPEGDIFQARKGAVIHMEELKMYTKEQIEQARHYEDQNTKD